MTRHWLHELPLTGRAAAMRRELSAGEFPSVEASVERLAMITDRPVLELAERLLRGMWAILNHQGPAVMFDLLADVIGDEEEHDR